MVDLLQFAVPVVVFTGIVLVLAGLVLVARRQLEPTGTVTIDLNGERRLEVEAGDMLLSCLADHGIFLPAACGGRGTCGQCRVTVRSGAGPARPTERMHITAAEAASGVRLACVLKLRRPLTLTVPPAILSVRRRRAVVESTRHVATYLKELVLKPADGAPFEFEAGEYVLLEAPATRIAFSAFELPERYRAPWREHGFLRLEAEIREPTTRAYSLANPPHESDRAVIVVRIATPPPTAPAGTPPGQVSSYLFSLEPGDEVVVRGPYGEFRAQDTDRDMVLIAGGAGIAPMRSIIFDQLHRGTRRKLSFWYGARDLGDLCYHDEFEQAAAAHANLDYHVALSASAPDSTWRGARGLIHAVVYEQYLKRHPAPTELEYYLCGPPVMSSAVIRMLEQLGVGRDRIFYDDFGD
jgi:Na+-transporting NADH:ubiquinone oxidoreductase subunit F